MEKHPVIGIIGGKGRMGKLFADFFVERGITVLISDLGTNRRQQAPLPKQTKVLASTLTKLNNRQVAEKADILIISVPIDHAEKVIKETLPYVRKSSALMDFTSVKENTVRAMLKAKCEVLGVHPMFGNSNPIPGQTVILCPTKKSGPWSKWLEDFLLKNNVQIYKMSAKEHDKIMNIVQGLIHFAEITFGEAIRLTKMPVKEILKYTGKASELKVLLAARIFDQDADLYGNIQIKNPQALNSLKLYKKAVEQLYDIVKKRDLKGFTKYFLNNAKHFGSYTKEAFQDSSYLIDRFLELKKSRQKSTPSVKRPSKNDLALLGPKNTHSDGAATKYLEEQKSSLKKYYAKDIDEIFELTEEGKVAMGLVPIENNFHGTVRETLDALFTKKVHIFDSIKIPIHHSLIALVNSKKAQIKTVISHSQALHQCKDYLKKNFPGIDKQTTVSTGFAIEQLLKSNDSSLAVIASEIAVDNNPALKILDTNIEDSSDNVTTFFIIAKGAAKSYPENQNTSIAFHFDADAPGSLFQVFQDFASNSINLTKIESRPTKKQFGDYIFYLDFEGSLSDPKVQKALKSVSKKVAKLKILGSF